MKSGESFINIDENGISIVGAMIEVNTGGAVVIGFTDQVAELPLGEALPEFNEEAPPIMPVQQKQTIITAAEEGSAICQECQEAIEAEQ